MERNRDVSGSRGAGSAGWAFRGLALAGFGTALMLGLALAAPAAADSNFERGFEDQLGRIAAVEAVHLGKHLLLHGAGHHVVHASHVEASVRYVSPGRHPRRHAHRHHWRHDRGRHLGHWKHGKHRGYSRCGDRYRVSDRY